MIDVEARACSIRLKIIIVKVIILLVVIIVVIIVVIAQFIFEFILKVIVAGVFDTQLNEVPVWMVGNFIDNSAAM